MFKLTHHIFAPRLRAAPFLCAAILSAISGSNSFCQSEASKRHEGIPGHGSLQQELDGLLPNNTVSNQQANVLTITEAVKRFGSSDPAACRAFDMLANTQNRLGNNLAAIADCDACRQLKETTPGQHLAASVLKSECYASERKFDQAEAACKEAIATPAPEFARNVFAPIMYLNAAQYCEQTGGGDKQTETDRGKILSDYIQAADKAGNPRFNKYAELALRYEGEAYHLAGDKALTNAAFGEYLKRFPTSDDAAFVALEQAQANMGDHPVPDTKTLESIASRYRTDTASGITVMYNLGMSYLAAKQNKDAEKAFAKVSGYVRQHPEAPPVIAAIVPLSSGNAMLAYLFDGEKDKAVAQAKLLLATHQDCALTDQAKRIVASEDLEQARKRKGSIRTFLVAACLFSILTTFIAFRVRGRSREADGDPA